MIRCSSLMSREIVAWVLLIPLAWGLIPQLLQKLLLGLDDLLADDLEELVLAVVFHFLEASVPIFLSSISQKLFLESRTSLVVYFEVLTRTWSPFFRENALPPSTER